MTAGEFMTLLKRADSVYVLEMWGYKGAVIDEN